MGVDELLALIGGIIIAGFIAELIFKVYKIPSVVLLMGIGLLLGPVFGVFKADEFMSIAPFFGKLALLIILFAGGLSLKIETVVAQLGNAVMLALVAFLITFGLSLPIGLYLIKLDMIQAVLMATLIAGTASSIVIPVVSKLSVNESTKTLLSIESAISNLFILVTVVLVCDIHIAPDTGFFGIFAVFGKKVFVSLIAAVIAGFVWARLIGTLKDSAFSYMLTLGFIFFLNYFVAELDGSGAISTLFFGIVLANVQRIFDITGPRIKKLLGIEVDSTKYALTEFVKNISKELSFLVATFFFVFLGLLVNLELIKDADFIINILFLSLAIVAGRFITMPLFGKISKQKFSAAETVILISMMPRGLATAVMAFKPAEEPYFIEGTELFPMYAMFAILISNLLMTFAVKIGENMLKKEAKRSEGDTGLEAAPELITAGSDETEREDGEVHKVKEPPIIEEVLADAKVSDSKISKKVTPPLDYLDSEEGFVAEGTDIEALSGFNRMIFNLLRIKKGAYGTFLRSTLANLRIKNGIFWLKIIGMVIISSLALLMNRPEIMIASMLLFPLTELINAVGFGIVTGDVYLLLKANVKIALAVFVTFIIAILVTVIAPFMGVTDQMVGQTQPTVLNFLLSLATGMILPVLLLKGNRFETFALIPVIGILFIPPLANAGISFALGFSHPFFTRGVTGSLSTFGTNLSCIIIGTVISQFLLGMNVLSQFSERKKLMEWHQIEIERGQLHGFFERWGLSRFLESVGTTKARIAVLGIVGIAIFIPLQMAVLDVQREYNLNAHLNEMALAYFEEDGKSEVTGKAFEDKTTSMIVTIKVATKDRYGQEVVDRFEDEMEKKIGVPIQLRLLQSQNTYNETGSVDVLPIEAEEMPKTLVERADFLLGDIESYLQPLKKLKNFDFIGYSLNLDPISDAIEVNVNVLGDESVGEVLQSYLEQDLRKKMATPNLFLNFNSSKANQSFSVQDWQDNLGLERLNSQLAYLKSDSSFNFSVQLPLALRVEDSLVDLQKKLPNLPSPERCRVEYLEKDSVFTLISKR